MDKATNDAWNLWFDKRFDAEINKWCQDMLIEAVGYALAEERKGMRSHVAEAIAKLSEEIGQLRAEVEILRGIIASNNVTPIGRGKDDAAA